MVIKVIQIMRNADHAKSQRRLLAIMAGEARRLLVAAPAYFGKHGRPACTADLEAHRGILYANRESDWRFAGAEGWVVARPRAALRVNNGLIMRDAAIEGLGISLLPSFYVNEALELGRKPINGAFEV